MHLIERWETTFNKQADERKTHQPEHGHLKGDDKGRRDREYWLAADEQRVEQRDALQEKNTEAHAKSRAKQPDAWDIGLGSGTAQNSAFYGDTGEDVDIVVADAQVVEFSDAIGRGINIL